MTSNIGIQHCRDSTQIDIVTNFDVSPLGVIFIILLIYVLLGCVFESMSMILLTVPIFAPLVEGLGFDLIWFGILVVVVTEIGVRLASAARAAAARAL